MYSVGAIAETAIGEDRRHYNPIQKDCATFLKTSEEMGGEYTLIEVEVAPGGGTTPHSHQTFDEHFEVLAGALEVTVGGRTHTLRAGEKAVAPRDTLHRFHNPTDGPVRFLVELRPGSAGFEKALKVAYGLARDGRALSDGTPKNPLHLAILLDWSEIRLPGGPAVVGPVFRLLAGLARRRGIDRTLERTYCR